MSPLLIVVAVSSLSFYWQLSRRRRLDAAARELTWWPFDPAVHGPSLDSSIRTLVAAFGVDTFEAPALEVPPAHLTDRNAYLTNAITLAAARFQVSLPVLDLQFSRLPDAAGLADYEGGLHQAAVGGTGVTLTPSGGPQGTWRIRLDLDYRDNDLAVTVIAAHELAHFVLAREGLDGGDEQLVEVALVLLGYGPLMRRLRSTNQPLRRIGKRSRYAVAGPGYLHPRAVEHVMLRRSELMAS